MKALFVAALAILSCLVGSSDATHTVSPVCGYQAIVVNGRCQCPAPLVGEPDFYCYRPVGCVTCRLKCDPELRTFDNQSTTLHLLASNVLSNVKTKFGGVLLGGHCHLVLKSWSARFKGKFYIKAVEFHIKITFKSGKSIHIWGRIITWVEKSPTGKLIYKWLIYFYSHKAKKYIPFKLLATSGTGSCFRKFIGCTINFHICPVTKFLVVTFRGCQQQFGIRPFNPFKPNIPGVWVKVISNAIFPLDLLDSLCSRPENGRDIEVVRKQFGFDTRKQLMTFLAITYKCSPIYYKNSPPNLKFLKLALINCPRPFVTEFFKKGEFLFENAALIRCLGPPKLEPLIDVILKFLKAFCNRNSHSKIRCQNAVQWVKDKCPHYKNYPKLKSYLLSICSDF